MFVMQKKYILICFFLLLFSVTSSYAANGCLEIATQTDTFACEKVSLQIDSTSYFPSETVWYTAHVLSDTEDGLHKSKVLYVDLLSPDGVLLQQQKQQITDSQCHGSFVLTKGFSLDQRDVNLFYPSGSYQIRAYTRRMLNGNIEGNKEDGLMLDGWVVDKGDHPLEGITVMASIDTESGSAARKVKTKTDRQGYWCLPMDDFSGTSQVRLSLDGKKNRNRRIVVRQSLCNDLSSQLAEYGTLRAGGIVTDGYVQCFDMLNEEDIRIELGLKSGSVADFLTDKGLKTWVDYSEVSYFPNQPASERFYTEEDYGNIDLSNQRLNQTDGRRFAHPVPSLVSKGSNVNGHPVRWNIKVPNDFPAKIYDREITYTRDIDIKYVKSILLTDYEPATHPYVTVSVVLRNAKEIGNNGPDHRTIHFAGYSTTARSNASTYPDDPMQGEKSNRRTIYWNPKVVTEDTGCTTLSFHINGNSRTLTSSVEGFTSDSMSNTNK